MSLNKYTTGAIPDDVVIWTPTMELRIYRIKVYKWNSDATFYRTNDDTLQQKYVNNTGQVEWRDVRVFSEE